MTYHVCEIIPLSEHPDYAPVGHGEPPRFFLLNGVPHERSDLGIQAMNLRDLNERIRELVQAEGYFRDNGWRTAANIWADWRRELAAVWAEYAHQGGEL